MKKDKIEEFYCADFEASDNRNETDKPEAWVWLWGLVDLNTMTGKTGRSIDTFMEEVFKLADKEKVIRVNFRNLKYDDGFILYWLHKNGWEEKERVCKDGRYKTMINAESQHFSITLQVNGGRIVFEDSLKKIPFSIEETAEMLKLPIKKGRIDYSRVIRPEDPITQEDIDYVLNDCMIDAMSLKMVLFDRGFTKGTIAANAMAHFKELHKVDFRYLFPVLSEEEDEFVRKSYRGGLCMTAGVEHYEGDIFVLDKNSMYPSMMHKSSGNYYPVGKGVYFKGKYKYDEEYPIYVCRVYITMKVKPGHFPSIGIKHFYQRKQEFITECTYEELVLTSIDLDTIYENYDVEEIDFLDGYKYHVCSNLFDKYINYWYKEKEEAAKTGDEFRRLCAKLFLNSLYGKFGQRLWMGKQRLELNDDDILKGEASLKECEGIYIPVASFVSAYARRDLLRAANKLGGTANVLYMDTDSLHTTNIHYKEFLNIDNYELGAWKFEDYADEGIYIRQKTYAEHIDGEWVIKCAGMSKKMKESIDIKEFREGVEFSGNLKQVRVKGGNILIESTFKIQ